MKKKSAAVSPYKKQQITTAVISLAYVILPDLVPGPLDDAVIGVIAAVLELIWAVKAYKANKNNGGNDNSYNVKM